MARAAGGDSGVAEIRLLTIYLLRRGTDGPDGALDADLLGVVRRRELRAGLTFTGALYVRAQQTKPPAWQRFVNDGLANADVLNLGNRSAAAVLVSRVARHWFAIPFGFGRHLIRDEAIELGFGLRATLNSVDPDRLRSVDMRTVDEMTLQTRRQASRISGLEVFGINITKDILGGVTGQPREPPLAQVMTGRDACVLQGPVTFEALDQKCRQLLAAYSRNDYQERFGWIDQLTAVEDETLTAALDDLLVTAFAGHHLESLHLAAPEQLDWDQVSGFRYSIEPDGASLRPDPDALEYAQARLLRPRARPELDVVQLRRDKVLVFGGPADAQLAAWPIHRCAVYQTPFADNLYTLSGGQWYQIAPTFAAASRHRWRAFLSSRPATWGCPRPSPARPNRTTSSARRRSWPPLSARRSR